MFIGHFGLGFAAKKAAPALSLGVLFIATQFIDLLWPVLLLLNLEHVEIVPGITKVTPLDFTHYPISHSLLMVIFWAMLFGVVTFMITKNKKYSLVIGALVVSHWVLDLVAHRPDLPLYPGESPKVGLGLWNYKLVTFIVESAIFFGGLFYYIKTTRPADNIGKYGLLGLTVFLFGIHISNMVGPPPPSVSMIAWAGHLQWIFVLLAFWIDRHRTLVVNRED